MRTHYWVSQCGDAFEVFHEDVGSHQTGLPDGYDLDSPYIFCVVCEAFLVDLEDTPQSARKYRRGHRVFSVEEEAVGSPRNLRPCERLSRDQWVSTVKNELRELKVTPHETISKLVPKKGRDEDEERILQLQAQGMTEEGALAQSWLIWWLEMAREYADDEAA